MKLVLRGGPQQIVWADENLNANPHKLKINVWAGIIDNFMFCLMVYSTPTKMEEEF